ncbi:MAG: pilus assembly protein [Bauldia sp.]|nr:MAG: pilus assembly protein [Bauldia sp.]MBZ0230612.1 pilus assembly protein [Bauldia sp.]
MAINPSKEVSATPAKALPAFGRFGRDDRGATAVEFGLIALPFFALLFAIIETALVFFAGQALETAVANSARLIRTGQAQQLNFSASDFRNDVCGQVMALFDCANKLVIDVQTFNSFASINLAPPLDADGNLDTTSKYVPGSGGQIVVVRAYYEWPVIVQMLGLDLTNMANGTHLMSAAAAFRNEPFPW